MKYRNGKIVNSMRNEEKSLSEKLQMPTQEKGTYIKMFLNFGSNEVRILLSIFDKFNFITKK